MKIMRHDILFLFSQLGGALVQQDGSATSLFSDDQSPSGGNRYCRILWNGAVTERGFLSFFEPEAYDRLVAVTYISSPRFFFRITEGFRLVVLVLGIPDGDVARQFDFLNPNTTLKFWNELTDSQRQRVHDGSIEARYAPKGHAIHSKIYLLNGPNKRRVMMGSANLTQHATQGSQFEEVVVWDTREMCDIYEQRVEEILAETVDYIPEEVKHRISAIDLTTASPEMYTRILDEVVSQNKVGLIIPSDRVQEIKDRIKTVEVEQEQVTLLRNIVETIAVPLSSNKHLISSANLAKNPERVRKLFVKTKKTDKGALPDVLPVLTVGDDMRLFRDGNVEEPYAHSLLEAPQITGYLERIGQFMDAYRRFTVQDGDLVANQKRVYEAVLYSFLSPYLWRIRQDIEQEHLGMRGDIPPFLLLAGKAWSGKTHLLRFISILLGGDGEFYHYEQLGPSGIRAFIDQPDNPTPNVFPVLIDEVDKEYFSGTGNRGEGMLKYLADQLTAVHPCLIGTTNNTFRANSQIVRRMYYLEVSCAFVEESRAQSEHFFQEIVDGLDASLFKDFTIRVQDKIRDANDYYDGHDFLAPARTVFQEYYGMAKMALPAWFPSGILQDYYDRGRRIWHELYKTHKNCFHVEGDRIKVDLRDLFGEGFEKYTSIKLLPAQVVLEDQNILVLRRKEFLKFLRLKTWRFFELFRDK